MNDEKFEGFTTVNQKSLPYTKIINVEELFKTLYVDINLDTFLSSLIDDRLLINVN